MNNKDGKRGEFMTSSRQSSRARTPDFLKLAGRNMRRSRGAGKAAAEDALALLVSGAVKSQTAAAAAVGVSQGQLSSVKTQLKPAHYKFTQQPTEVVELSEGVTFIKELSFGDETNMSMEEKRARRNRNYQHKMAALLQVAAVAAAAAAPTAEVGGTGLELGAEQSGVELGEAELSGAEGELDEAGGEAGGELTETAESELWRQIEALNGLRTAGSSAAACKATAQVASPGALTCQILGLDHSHAERRTRSYTPHERAALSAAQRRNVSENHTVCLCACSGTPASSVSSSDERRASRMEAVQCMVQIASLIMRCRFQCSWPKRTWTSMAGAQPSPFQSATGVSSRRR